MIKYQGNIVRLISRFSTSTNPRDVLNFNKVKDWWNVGGSMQALWHYNYLRVSFIHDILRIQQQHNSLKDFKMLDVGVGGGILSESLSRLGANVLGIDVSQNSIDIAEGHRIKDPLLKNAKNLTYQLIAPENLDPIYNNSFDVATAMEVLEHVNDKETFIGAISQNIKPGGWIFISTMSKTWESYLKLIIGAEYIGGIVKIGTHDWNSFINPDELQQIMKRYNLQVKDIRGVNYDLITGRLDYSNNMTQYILAAQKNN